MQKRILVVDDEPLIVKGLKYSLEQDGYSVEEAYDGEEAVSKALDGDFDLILLDVMLPRMSGMEVCQRVREKSHVPIIMITAKGEDMDKVLGLEHGADDYMTKPFNILEVKARMKSVFRRTAQGKNDKDKQGVNIHDLSMNFINRSVEVGRKDVNLTAKEFDLLRLFATNRGKVFSRRDLMGTVWKSESVKDIRAVDVHIRRLREKIEKNPAQPEYILTKWGVGYYFANK
ncbi:MAG: response regulator transcription factor [Bacillota bacterium]|nr:response regulator transcription factor [Bacillota bacterium]